MVNPNNPQQINDTVAIREGLSLHIDLIGADMPHTNTQRKAESGDQESALGLIVVEAMTEVMEQDTKQVTEGDISWQ